MRKLLLLAAMLAMVLVVASPALAQQTQRGTESGAGDLNQAQCQNEAFAGNQLQYGGSGNTQVGGNTVINQNCVANAGGQVEQINVQEGGGTVVAADGGGGGGDVNVVKTVTGATGKTVNVVAVGGDTFKAVGVTVINNVEVPVFVDTTGVFFTIVNKEVVVVEETNVTFFTTNVTNVTDVTKVQYGATQYQYAAPTKTALTVLPDTGGASLITLGAGALLVAGGLLARRIVR